MHPLKDDLAAHLRLNEETGRIEHLSETGCEHIGILQLNRPALIAHRRFKRIVSQMLEAYQLQTNEIVRLKRFIQDLRFRLDEFDA